MEDLKTLSETLKPRTFYILPLIILAGVGIALSVLLEIYWLPLIIVLLCTSLCLILIFGKRTVWLLAFMLLPISFYIPTHRLLILIVLAFYIFSIFLYLSPYRFSLVYSLQEYRWLLLMTAAVILTQINLITTNTLNSVAFLNTTYLLFYFASYPFFLFIASRLNFDQFVENYLLSSIIFIIILYSLASFMPWYLDGRLSIKGIIHPNQVSMYLEFFFPFFLFLWLYPPIKKQRVFYALGALLTSTTILLTYSRGGLLTIICIASFFAFKRLTFKRLVPFVFLCLALAFVFYQGFYKRSNFNSIDNLLSTATRLEIQKVGIRMFFDSNPIWGYGVNEFHHLKFDAGFPAYLDMEGIMSTHSLYLELLLGVGIFGFIAYLGLSIKILYQLIRYPLKIHEGYRLGIIFGIISYFLHGFMDCNLPSAPFTMSYMCLLACGRHLINQSEADNRTGSLLTFHPL